MTKLGRTVKQAREERGYTQQELADRVGVRQTTIADIERGRSKLPQPSLRRALARELGMRHVDLLIDAGELTHDEVAPAVEPFPGDPVRSELVRMVRALPDDEEAMDFARRALRLIRGSSQWSELAPGDQPGSSRAAAAHPAAERAAS